MYWVLNGSDTSNMVKVSMTYNQGLCSLSRWTSYPKISSFEAVRFGLRLFQSRQASREQQRCRDAYQKFRAMRSLYNIQTRNVHLLSEKRPRIQGVAGLFHQWGPRSRRSSAKQDNTALIARFMGPTWGPSGADRAQVVPMLATWTLLSGWLTTTYLCHGLGKNGGSVTMYGYYNPTNERIYFEYWRLHECISWQLKCSGSSGSNFISDSSIYT